MIETIETLKAVGDAPSVLVLSACLGLAKVLPPLLDWAKWIDGRRRPEK